jgi:aldose 1-epimerase
MNVYSLSNALGMRVRVLDFGCTIVSVEVPDRSGRLADVALGLAQSEAYRARHPYFGCVVGRFGNRIANGRFVLAGKTYELARNNSPGGKPCHLHGGIEGFDQKTWDAHFARTDAGEEVSFQRVSSDGEEGFPGNLKVGVLYRLTESNALEIEYSATTDAPTLVNLTNHSYFNLRGEGNGDICSHELTLHASHFLPTDAGQIPTGELRPVAGTPFDFRSPHFIGERIDAADEQLAHGGGYDHNWVLDSAPGQLALAAEVYEPESGRLMRVLTTEPGVQLYTGNVLDGSFVGKSGRAYQRRTGLCLETQHFPDAPNQAGFPSTVLEPGEVYRSKTVYQFSTR